MTWKVAASVVVWERNNWVQPAGVLSRSPAFVVSVIAHPMRMLFAVGEGLIDTAQGSAGVLLVHAWKNAIYSPSTVTSDRN